MQKKVLITIRGEQTLDTGETDSTEFTTEGTLTAAERVCLLAYDESELTGMEGTHVTLQLRPHSAVLHRTGTFRSQMIYEPGKKHTSVYQTPYGTMRLALDTRTLENTITDQGGTLQIDYSLAIDRQVTSENRLHITVRPITEQ